MKSKPYSPAGKQRVTLFINPDVLRRARALAVLKKGSLSRVTENALVQFTGEKSFKNSLSASGVSTGSQKL